MNDFEQKLYNIVKEAINTFDKRALVNSILEDFVIREASGLLRLAYEKEDKVKEVISDEELIALWNNKQMLDACRKYARKYGCNLRQARLGMYELVGQNPL